MPVNSRQITHTLRQKWPEAVRSLTDISDCFFSTGRAELDALFPSGRGIPYGQLIEITGGVSSGKTSLLLHLLATNSRRTEPFSNSAGNITGKTTAYVDFGNSFFPDAAGAAGLDLSRLLVIKPTSAQLKSGLRSGELLLRDRHADIIVFDLAGWRQSLPIGLLHRLRLKTVRAKGLVIFLTQAADIIPASMTSLRLEVQRSSDRPHHLLITVTKSRLCAEGLQCQVRL